jgi:hypothetical protein
MKKKIFFIHFISTAIQSFYDDIALENITVELECDNIEHDSEHTIYREIIQRLSRIWFVVDVLLSTQLGIQHDDVIYHDILKDLMIIISLVSSLKKINFSHFHKEEFIVMNTIINHLAAHGIIEYNNPLNTALQFLKNYSSE